MEIRDGIERIPVETMRLLIEFSEHRSICDECEKAFDDKTGHYCPTGAGIFQQITEQPDVIVTPE